MCFLSICLAEAVPIAGQSAVQARAESRYESRSTILAHTSRWESKDGGAEDTGSRAVLAPGYRNQTASHLKGQGGSTRQNSDPRE